MIIHNNLAALQTLGQMHRNTKKSEKSARQLSTGEKITGAGDGASEYAISEKMRAKIRGLNQCVANTKNGRNMLDTASKAVEEQVEIMKKVRALTMKSSDGIYTQQDRDILQAEVNQLLDECEDLAQQTNFNGIPLLNQYTLGDQTTWFDPYAEYKPIPSTIPVIPEAAAESDGKYHLPTYTAVTEDGSGNTTNCYDPTQWTTGAAYTVLPAAGNFVFDSSGVQHQIVADTDGTLYLDTPGTGTLVEVNGVKNPPTSSSPPPTSTNIFRREHPPLQVTALTQGQNVITSKTGTTADAVIDLEPGSGKPILRGPGNTSKGSLSALEIDFSDLVNALQAQGKSIPAGLNELGFSLICDACPQFVTIKFDATTDASSVYGGNPNSETRNPICYVIGVKNVTNADTLAETIFNGLGSASGTGTGTVPSTGDETVRIAQAHQINMNYFAGSPPKFTITKDGPSMQYWNGVKGELITEYFYEPYQDKALQTETTSSQYLNVRVQNTTLDVLFPPKDPHILVDPKESDYPSDWPNEYEWNHKENRPMTEAEKKAKWKEEVWKYPAKRLDLDKAKCIRTREQAAEFIDDVDQAIKYLLYTNTTLGAQSNRLNYTEANLVTAAENTTGAESTIRDANMAKSMVDFTKNNILVQAAQAMLAQANQTPQGVLSLLQ